MEKKGMFHNLSVITLSLSAEFFNALLQVRYLSFARRQKVFYRLLSLSRLISSSTSRTDPVIVGHAYPRQLWKSTTAGSSKSFQNEMTENIPDELDHQVVISIKKKQPKAVERTICTNDSCLSRRFRASRFGGCSPFSRAEPQKKLAGYRKSRELRDLLFNHNVHF